MEGANKLQHEITTKKKTKIGTVKKVETRDPIENFPIKENAEKLHRTREGYVYLRKSFLIVVVFWPFSSRFFPPHLRIARVRARMCVWVCRFGCDCWVVYVNISYLVVTLYKTNKPPICTTIVVWTKMLSSLYLLLCRFWCCTMCMMRVSVYAGVQRFRAIFWVLFHTKCVYICMCVCVWVGACVVFKRCRIFVLQSSRFLVILWMCMRVFFVCFIFNSEISCSSWYGYEDFYTILCMAISI